MPTRTCLWSRSTGQRRFHRLPLFMALTTSMVGCSVEDRASTSVETAGALALTWDNLFTVSNGSRQVRVSPDGRYVAVAATTESGTHIYLVEPGAAGEPQQWMEGDSPIWFPSGNRMVFSRAGDLWAVDVHSTEATRITNDNENERAARVSPDGALVAFYSSRSGAQDLWIVPSDGSEPARQLTRDAMSIDDPRFAPGWSPDGTEIAYISNAGDYWEDDVWVVDVESGETGQVSSGLMASSSPIYAPDGRTIALMGTSKSEYWYEDLAYIYLVDPAGGSERTVDMQVWATDWLHNHEIAWSADGRELYFPYMERGGFDIWRIAADGGVATRVTNEGGALRAWHASTTAVPPAMALLQETPVRGREVDWVAGVGASAVQLTSFSPEWEGVQAPAEVSYRSWDGLHIQGFLYLPPDFDQEARYPTLVNVHGGGTNSYLRAQNLTEQTLASKGYVVLAVNYRGGSGFGRSFQDLGINDWANGQARDAAAAADYLRALPYSNGRVGIYGYSYGGITSMAAIARVPDAFDAAVPMAGIYDFGDAYTNADRLGKIFIRTGHGGSPEERPDIYAISNTLARVGQIQTPLLVMHGEADVRAPFPQYQLVVAQLEADGKDFESHSYPDEPHGFRNPDNRIDMYQRLEAFFDARLR